MRRAVFLDRDGVLIRDVDLLRSPEEVEILPGVPEGLRRLADAGRLLVVVTNQPVIARGLATEADVDAAHARLQALLRAAGAPAIDRFYVCPHHPNANVAAYRAACACRKPRPGMLLRAAEEMRIDLGRSALVGDRASDVLAGRRAGCRTVQVLSGRHDAPPIEGPDPPEESRPDAVSEDLLEAAERILEDRA